MQKIPEAFINSLPGSLLKTPIMGKTSDLTDVKKAIIDTLKQEGKTQKEISQQIGCSQSAVSRHLNGKSVGRKQCGRKRCTTRRGDRTLRKIVEKDQFQTLGNLRKQWTESGVETSRATVHRRVQEMGYRCRIPQCCRERESWNQAIQPRCECSSASTPIIVYWTACDSRVIYSPIENKICLKGKVHIFKFLNIHACCRTEKKPDSLDLPPLVKRLPSQPLTDSIEDFYPSKNHGPDSGIGSDNGDKRLSTTEPSDDDTISLHSQVSESRDQALKNDNHLLGSKLDSHKGHDQEIYDYDPSAEDTDHSDVQLTGPFVSYIKERGKLSDKSEKVEENEEWEEEQRIQKEQLLEEEEEDEIKEVTDLRKIAAQLLQQEKHNSCSSGDHSQLSPCNWQDGEKDRINEQGWPSAECAVWQAEERRRSKQTRREYFKYKSSRKCSTGNDNDEQNSDSANVSPSSPVSSEDCERSHSNSPTPFGLKPRSAFSRSSRQEGGSLDPGFTMRRKMEHLREEREQIKQLRNNLESRLKVILPEDIGGALMDGVVLCHLANHIRPRSVASIHVPSPAVSHILFIFPSIWSCERLFLAGQILHLNNTIDVTIKSTGERGEKSPKCCEIEIAKKKSAISLFFFF
ncbi:unnamed protein product [Ranitomeya imitator]|uniref:Uncharacterized protein n=1 Tax=Ranitomeya imitator TaxID=111125 RepID=A0ABN9LIZ0_9NEOB|nr:unnamed protein product [Ranitomeya imitator]